MTRRKNHPPYGARKENETMAKKNTTKKTSAKKTPAKKTPAKTTSAKRVPAKKKIPAKKSVATSLLDAPIDTTMDLGANDGIQIDIPYNPEPDADERQDAPQAATTDAPAKVRRPGGLDAAYRLLVEEGRPMTAIEMTKITIERGMWTPAGKTPSNTMYAGIFNEIKKKGASARFIKVEKGFVHNPNI